VTAHFLSSDRRPFRQSNNLIRLDWREFWLFVAVLGGLLATVVVVFMAALSSR